VVLHMPAATAHAAHPASHEPAAVHGHGDHGEHLAVQAGEAQAAGLGAVAVHTAAMFAAMAAAALLVYEKLGLAVLRRAWFNLDLLWAWSLVLAGALSLPLPPW
jgi:hypothetical protein